MALISYFLPKQSTQEWINWHVPYVYFNIAKHTIEFKFNEYTTIVDLNFILENLLPYFDNQKIVKLEYRSPSINNEGKIVFSNFEPKAGANVRVMWNIIFLLWNKMFDRVGCDGCEIDQRYYEDVGTPTWMLKCNVRFMLMISYVMFYFLCYQC